MNLEDARAIDQYIDFDCHHKQLNLNCFATTESPTSIYYQHFHTHAHTRAHTHAVKLDARFKFNSLQVSREQLVSMFFKGCLETSGIMFRSPKMKIPSAP